MVAAVLVVLYVIGVLTESHGRGSASQTPSAASASYTAIYTSIDIVSSSQVNVSVLVQDIGTTAGTPGCTIIVGTPDYAGTGYQTFLADSPISPGNSTTYREHVTITNNNASKVTLAASSVTCS